MVRERISRIWHLLGFPRISSFSAVLASLLKVKKTEFSPFSGESCRSLCPLRPGERTLWGLGRNPITEAVGNFKTSILKVLVVSSVALYRTKSSLLKAVSCSRGLGGGNRADLEQADFPGTQWEVWGCFMHSLIRIGSCRSRSSLGFDWGMSDGKLGKLILNGKLWKLFFSPSYFQIMAFKFRSNSRTFLPSGWDTACQVSAVMRWMSWEHTCTFLFFRAVPEDFRGGM